MKRQKNKHRFYLWDYLWWTGERLHDYHSRITGDDMLQMHFMFFVYFPILMLCAFAKPAFVNRSFFIYLLAFYFVLLLVWWIWNKQIYRASRRKAVMKHYADVNFNPGKGFLLFFMPLIFFIGVVITLRGVIAENQRLFKHFSKRFIDNPSVGPTISYTWHIIPASYP